MEIQTHPGGSYSEIKGFEARRLRRHAALMKEKQRRLSFLRSGSSEGPPSSGSEVRRK